MQRQQVNRNSKNRPANGSRDTVRLIRAVFLFCICSTATVSAVAQSADSITVIPDDSIRVQTNNFTHSKIDNQIPVYKNHSIVVQPDTMYIRYYMVPTPEVPAPLFALKTNLLFDIATAVNAEIEVPIGKRWSIAGEWIFPWWLIKHKQYAFEGGVATLEGRYWFGEPTCRRTMTGWFAGIYLGAGYYDLEWSERGQQGEFFHTGISGGYAHIINKKGTLRMEYSLGVGYLGAKYREYIPELGPDGEWYLMGQSRGNFKWIGPTRAKVSLVWMLPKGFWKKGGSK